MYFVQGDTRVAWGAKTGPPKCSPLPSPSTACLEEQYIYAGFELIKPGTSGL